MKICFPIRKRDGREYRTLDEVMALIGREPHGSWLAGTNYLWHGGIHLSNLSAPGSVLAPDSAATAVPLQCMVNGEVVAWRLNNDYLTANYNGKTLRYSSTMILVKSLCQPDPQKNNSWLEFYTLYLGLAPLSDFVKRKYMKAKTGLLKHPAGAFESSHCADPVPTISPGKGQLSKGTRIIILRTAMFLNHGKPQTFGLAKTLNAHGEETGEPFWVTIMPEFMEPDGEQYAQLPVWMQRAEAQGIYNSLVKPSAKLEIEAGDAIGFLGEDIAPAGKSKVDSCHYVHIEVLSTDPRMPHFLNNPGQVACGQQYIRVPPDKPLYQKIGDGKNSTFTLMSHRVEKDGGIILPREKCHPFKDQNGATWFEISPYSWMAQGDVKELHQYDLKELGFTALNQSPSLDISESLRENWVQGAFNTFAANVIPDRGIGQQQLATFYKNLVKHITAGRGDSISVEQLYSAIHHPTMGIRDIAAHLIVKHDNEWSAGSHHPRWKAFFEDYDPLRIAYAKKWLDDMQWMNQVESFKNGDPVWHFHPVMFLGAINTSDEVINIDAFLKKYEQEHTNFAPGTRKLSQNCKNNIKKLLNNLNDFYYRSTEFKPNLYKIAYMLATARHETYHYTSSEFFSEKPEIGDKNYFNMYDPILADTPKKRKNAINYGNTAQGDGFKYRGRGCVHLTWKNNYKKASDKFGINFVEKPELAGDLTHSVPIMVWGMENGIFTGKSLKDYINESKVDYTTARYIINGKDNSALIASYATKLQAILEETSTITKAF
ncbi:hypothetical protein SJI19_06500 [Acerihabitans sp. TG2]|uniref:hypothetical protein n=1 Tax=Acerihabitans sp. TG2 TaxID=3096008 RepID=UPI002B22631D|nr:hypothetical protein [Acerihabitans sp. TG2]MEA9390201.1 hypothetical protein [Acerihabitans sp. TG2]